MMDRWVKDALQHAGISQAELARQLHVRFNWQPDRSIINKMVTGRREVGAEEAMQISEVTKFPLPIEEKASWEKALADALASAIASGIHDREIQRKVISILEEIERNRQEDMKQVYEVSQRILGMRDSESEDGK